MKHILICLICTVVLFAYIGSVTLADDLQSAELQTVDAVARVAVAATTQQVKKEVAEKPAVTQVGILLGHADDLGTARFKTTFEKGIATEIKVNSVDTAGSVDTQKTMFDKMAESSYNLVVMEMMKDSPADYFIDKAGQAGISMIIFGEKPEDELLLRYPNIYYIGFSGENLIEMMANETYTFWQSNPKLMNFEKDEWDLSYSAITSTGFEADGYKDMFNSTMLKLGVSSVMEVDSVVRHYDYDLHKEIDQTIIKDSELVFYDSSTEAQKAINYYYDPTEFSKRPKQQLALSVIDDNAVKLVEDGEVLFACGKDTRELGTLAARMAQLLLAGQTPSYQSLEREPTNERSFFLPYTVIRSDIAPEPVEDDEDK